MQPAVARTASGATVNIESFLFAVAERLELPGFGDNGTSDAQGNPCALKSAEDFYLSGLANMAIATPNWARANTRWTARRCPPTRSTPMA